MRFGVMILGAVGVLLTIAASVSAGQYDDPPLDGSVEQFRGLVYPSKQVDLTAPLGGVLKAIEVAEGENVKADRVLAQMDDAIQKVVVEAARMQWESQADIRRAQLELDEAQIMLDRIEDVAKRGAAKEWEVRRTRVQRDLAQVNYDAALRQKKLDKTSLDLELERLSRYQLKAPFDGRVIRTLAEPGATLTEIDKVLSLYALDPLEARLFLPTALYGKLQVGRRYKLSAGDPVNAELVGVLKTVDTVIDPASETFRCVFTIDNPDTKLPSGFTVHLPWPQESSATAVTDDE